MVTGDLADNRKDDQRVQGPPYIDQARRGLNEYTAIYTTTRIRAHEHLRSTVKNSVAMDNRGLRLPAQRITRHTIVVSI